MLRHLMGIRNLDRYPRQRRRLRLTTPHGDQEHLSKAGASNSVGGSLPLMGIRNAIHSERRGTRLLPH